VLELLAKRQGRMSNSTSISSDLINHRLGGGGRKTFYEPEAELADAVGDDESEGSGLSAGFMTMILILFLAVGGGTFYFDDLGFSWYEVKLMVGDLSRFRL
jgi:hypothetical protein